MSIGPRRAHCCCHHVAAYARRLSKPFGAPLVHTTAEAFLQSKRVRQEVLPDRITCAAAMCLRCCFSHDVNFRPGLKSDLRCWLCRISLSVRSWGIHAQMRPTGQDCIVSCLSGSLAPDSSLGRLTFISWVSSSQARPRRRPCSMLQDFLLLDFVHWATESRELPLFRASFRAVFGEDWHACRGRWGGLPQ